MPLMTFSEMTESEKKSIWGVVGLFFIVFLWFQIILSSDLDVLWRKAVTNLSQLYLMWLEPNRRNTQFRLCDQFPYISAWVSGINLWTIRHQFEFNMGTKNPSLLFFLASSFLVMADIIITFIITQVTYINIFHYSYFVFTFKTVQVNMWFPHISQRIKLSKRAE